MTWQFGSPETIHHIDFQTGVLEARTIPHPVHHDYLFLPEKVRYGGRVLAQFLDGTSITLDLLRHRVFVPSDRRGLKVMAGLRRQSAHDEPGNGRCFSYGHRPLREGAIVTRNGIALLGSTGDNEARVFSGWYTDAMATIQARGTLPDNDTWLKRPVRQFEAVPARMSAV